MAPRVAFALVALVVPAQLVTQWLWSEPYPALTQPAFAFSARPFPVTDALPKTVGVALVTFTDGATRVFRADELLPWTAGVSATTILRDTIIEREYAPKPTQDWLRERIAATGEKRQPASVTLQLEYRLVDAPTGRIVDSGITTTFTVTLSEVP